MIIKTLESGVAQSARSYDVSAPVQPEGTVRNSYEVREAEDGFSQGKHQDEEAYPETTPGARLFVLRVFRGLTQRELANSAKISSTYMNDLESDQRPLKEKAYAELLAEALGMKIGDFFQVEKPLPGIEISFVRQIMHWRQIKIYLNQMIREDKKAYQSYKKVTGVQIRRMREAEGFTRKDLAVKADITRSYLSYLEAGQYFPAAPFGMALAKALDMGISSLLPDVKEFVQELQQWKQVETFLNRMKRDDPKVYQKQLKELGMQFKSAREELRIAVTDLPKTINISEEYIMKLESGQVFPSPYLAVVFARALDRKAGDFFPVEYLTVA